MNKCKTENYFVSPYNFEEEVRRGFKPKSIEIHDITLRDGEQQAGVVFTKDEKLEIARKLDEAGVRRIEAGMPVVSKEDAKAVKAITNEGLGAKIYVFGRCMKRDVDLALENDADGIVMEIPSSDHLIKHAYDWEIEKAINAPVEATNYAAEHGLEVDFFTVDSTRSDFDTFWSIVKEVIDRGHMDSYSLIDTFGVASPEAITSLVKKIKGRIDCPLEIHAHNDFGLAVANSIAAAKAGAETIHTTVNGIGERCGNAALEEVVAALELLYDVDTGVDLKKLRALSKYVEEASEVKMPPQKSIVGSDVFTTESGIVTAWWERASEAGEPLEVYPLSPGFLGAENPKQVLGKGSGKASVTYKLKELGKDVPSDEEVREIVMKIKDLSLKKKGLLSNDEFMSIVNNVAEK